MDKIIREEARLIILRALADEPDGRCNSSLLVRHLEVFGINRPRSWTEAEVRELENRGAVRVMEAGSVLVAQLTARGQDHLERRAFLDGVKRPSLPEA
ncbi:hypothetical protein C8N35_102124 [Breoghania corrubedonensis]|uniref:Uncharacterized protein n=1 Tax=Breoghania corrubedonensis TaxID=665038 RepID=A0A2T5VCF5_9HYPH|nr:hypothetical protein [Breoghania corrubedonensis]PTW61415.1 hypothetical protein C8N35_102124 [Breoghania corrubedonensis]